MSLTSIKTVIEEFPTMVFSINADGKIYCWNKISEELTGYPASFAETEKDFLLKISPDGSLVEKVHAIQNIGKEQSTTLSNIEIICKDGSIKLFRFLLRFRESPFLEGLNTWVVGFDETEQTALNKAIKFSMDRFETISHATNDAVWEWDIEKDTLWWAGGLKDLFGHPEAGQTTSFQWWADRVHPSDRDRVVKKLQEAVQNKDKFWQDEYQFKRKDGTFCIVQDKGLSIFNDEGKVTRLIGGISDIMEKKIYEQSLMVKNQQLAEYAFFNSHKVRAPLARLLSCVDVLEVDTNLEAVNSEILRAIKSSALELDKEIREMGNLLSLDSNLGKNIGKRDS